MPPKSKKMTSTDKYKKICARLEPAIVRLKEKIEEGENKLERWSTTQEREEIRAKYLVVSDAIERRMETVEEYWQEWKQLAEIDEEVEQLYEDKYEEITGILLHAEDIKKELTIIRNEALSAGASTHPPGRSCRVKLPNIDLPKFSTGTVKWIEFFDLFRSVIHDNDSLDEITKFTYLISKLEGEARDLIKGLEIRSENYKIAVDILKDEYDHPSSAIDQHYLELVNVRPAKTLQELKKTYHVVESHLRALAALKQDIDQASFVTIVKSKIPSSVLATLNVNKGSIQWTMPLLREKLRAFLKAHKDADLVASPDDFSVDSLVPTTEGLLVRNRKVRLACFFCSKEHFTDECPTYDTIESRRKQMNNACEICLSKNHDRLSCQSDKACFHCKVSGKHHRSLCPTKFKARSSSHNSMVAADQCEQVDCTQVTELNADIESVDQSNELPTMVAVPRSRVYMQVAEATVSPQSNQQKRLNSLIFLDCGSGRSYISKECADSLGLKPISRETLSVNTFGTDAQTKVSSPVVQVSLFMKDGETMTLLLNVVPVITGQLNVAQDRHLVLPVPQESLALKFESSYSKKNIDILIGNDYYNDLILDSRIDVGDGLYLIQSRLGWILSGRALACGSDASEGCILSLLARDSYQDGYLPQDYSLSECLAIQDFWRLDILGIVEPTNNSDDELAIECFGKTVVFTEGRYSVTWPKKGDIGELPSNYELCFGRLKGLVKRLAESEHLREYNNIIIKEEMTGVIEKVDRAEDVVQYGHHYTPHHAVFTPNKTTTKVRKVHDASAKTKKSNPSLNDLLYRGPVILEDICALLLRFRTHPIAVIADIEKAFHQILLQEPERDLVRFLWLKDISQPVTRENIQIYRFVRVPFGVISSPFLLAATLQHHLSEAGTETASKLKRDIYVDNVITGSDSVEEAQSMYTETKKLFSDASMNLREWLSNSEQFMNNLKPEDKTTEQNCAKVLGVSWDIENDSLGIVAPNIDPGSQSSWTKRTILSTIARIPDLLGLFAPTVLLAKLLIQDLWLANCDWDEPLKPDLERRWMKIIESINKIQEVRLPRHVKCTMDAGFTFQLLAFTDASARAMGVAIYLHVQDPDGKPIGSNLIFAKARLLPKNSLTIPKAELSAVTLGVKCLAFVERSLHLSVVGKTVWTDSLCVLFWLDSNSRLSRFVENRLQTLRRAENTTFRYVASEDNPADVLTKGADPMELVEKGHFVGPDWLGKPTAEWPTWNKRVIPNQVLDDIETETLKNPSVVTTIIAEDTTPTEVTPWGLNLERFSSLTKLLRVTAWCNRMKKLRENRLKGPLTKGEIDSAKLQWDKYAQRCGFTDELRLLKQGSTNTYINKLNLILDGDGLVRCSHRLGNANFERDAIFPKIIPKNHPYTTLIIRHFHEKLFHSRTAHTLSQIRHSYWIPSGRRAVYSVIAGCTVCKRHHGGAYPYPRFPQLPASRVNRSHLFCHTGLDYLGPPYVRVEDRTVKVWICLFVCMVFRAVRLELVMDCTPEQFLLALRRFIARNKPSEIVSDNASHFKVVKSTIDAAWNEVLNDDSVQNYIAEHGIEWNFIVPSAPWMGGFYERLVGIVKSALRKGIGRLCLQCSQLQTLLVEVEAVVNSRPLVYVGEDLEAGVALTPAHFLGGDWFNGIPELSTDANDEDFVNKERADSAALLLQAWRKGQRHLNALWQIFQAEYLLSLRERTQTYLKQGRIRTQHQPKVNDVVLVMEKLPRGSWKMAIITELIYSADDQVRCAVLRLSNGCTIRRPVNKLCPIETSTINAEDSVGTVTDDNHDHDHEVDDPRPRTRPVRTCARKARDLFKTLDE